MGRLGCRTTLAALALAALTMCRVELVVAADTASTIKQLAYMIIKAPDDGTTTTIDVTANLDAVADDVNSDDALVTVQSGQVISVRGKGTSKITIDAKGKARHFYVKSGGVLLLDNLVLTGGKVDIWSTSENGAAVFVKGGGKGTALTVKNCDFTGNHVWGSGGAIEIFNADFTCSGSTFSGNSASGNTKNGQDFMAETARDPGMFQFKVSGCSFQSGKTGKPAVTWFTGGPDTPVTKCASKTCAAGQSCTDGVSAVQGRSTVWQAAGEALGVTCAQVPTAAPCQWGCSQAAAAAASPVVAALLAVALHACA